MTSTSMPRAAAAATPSTLAMPLSTVTIRRGLALRRERDDLRRQAVPVLEAIGHDEVDVRAHRAQARARRPRRRWRRRHRSRRRSRCARVAPIARQAGRRLRRCRAARRTAAARRAMIELGRARDAARGVHAREHRRHDRRPQASRPMCRESARANRDSSFERERAAAVTKLALDAPCSRRSHDRSVPASQLAAPPPSASSVTRRDRRARAPRRRDRANCALMAPAPSSPVTAGSDDDAHPHRQCRSFAASRLRRVASMRARPRATSPSRPARRMRRSTR